MVFAKAPTPGRVKTRLCPPLTSEQAAELYACMLADVLETTAEAAAQHDLEAWLAVDPPDACAQLAARAPARFRVVAQRGAGLAARMTHAVAACAATGAARILLRGSDSPALPEAHIGQALAALADADLCVCPDLDGGYSLIGLRGPVPGLFDHAMSHARVLDETLARAERAGQRVTRLPPCFDLDTAADLTRLARLRADDTPPCPRTLGWLDRERAWPRPGT